MIPEFQDEYRFLSNFWYAPVLFEEEWYSTVEHAYQAAKTGSFDLRKEIQAAQTPGQAKKLGQKVTLRSDWEQVKVKIMKDLLTQKFSTEPLRKKLLDTGDQELVEGNKWHDCFWGKCHCSRCGGKGENTLGKLLMEVRESLRTGNVKG